MPLSYKIQALRYVADNLNYTVAPADEGTYSLQAEFTEWGVTYQSSELLFKVRTLHLNDYSWSQIQQIIASGQAPVTFAECFENGCCKEIPLSAGTTTIPYNKDGDTAISAQNIYVNILGFDHDEPADGGTSRHTITFGMASADEILVKNEETGIYEITNFRANQTEKYPNGSGGVMDEKVLINTNKYVSNADQSTMSSFLHTVYEQCLPDELNDIILPIKKKTSAGEMSPEIVTTTPHLFLFSEVELFGQWYKNADGSITEAGNNNGRGDETCYGYLCSYEGEGSQYEYYAAVNDMANLNPLHYRLAREEGYWFERSPDTANRDMMCLVQLGSATSYYYYHINAFISFGFCIGG